MVRQGDLIVRLEGPRVHDSQGIVTDLGDVLQVPGERSEPVRGTEGSRLPAGPPACPAQCPGRPSECRARTCSFRDPPELETPSEIPSSKRHLDGSPSEARQQPWSIIFLIMVIIDYSCILENVAINSPHLEFEG